MGTDAIRAQARRLIAAANELLAVAHDLDRWDPDHSATDSQEPPFGRDLRIGDKPIYADAARTAYRSRRRRNEVFRDDSLFGEPAWDILLDLFIAAKDRKRLPVTSACIGAAVPTTTALRWLAVLEEKGLVVREQDTVDARRIFVRLSGTGYEKMVAYFAGAADSEACSDEGTREARAATWQR